MQEKLLSVIDASARHAASLSHCRLVKRWVTRTRPGIANHALATLVYDNLKLVQAPKFGGEAIAVAREIQRGLGFKPMKKPFAESCETFITPRMAEVKMRDTLPPWQKNFTSDDYVEMTWHAPAVRFYIGRPMLRAPPDFCYLHWVMNALGGIPACITPTILCASKTIGLSLVELLNSPKAIRAARMEFNKRTGGGVGGKKWISSLLPKDFCAPVNYRWPDYNNRNGKREWGIPANAEIDGNFAAIKA